MSVVVAASNAPPTARDLQVSTREDVPVAVGLSGSDPDGDALRFAVVAGPAHGRLSGTPQDLTYAPDADVNGTDRFTYTASDGTAPSAPATVSVTISEVNDPPVAHDDSFDLDPSGGPGSPDNVTLFVTERFNSALAKVTVANGVTTSRPELRHQPARRRARRRPLRHQRRPAHRQPRHRNDLTDRRAHRADPSGPSQRHHRPGPRRHLARTGRQRCLGHRLRLLGTRGDRSSLASRRGRRRPKPRRARPARRPDLQRDRHSAIRRAAHRRDRRARPTRRTRTAHRDHPNGTRRDDLRPPDHRALFSIRLRRPVRSRHRHRRQPEAHLRRRPQGGPQRRLLRRRRRHQRRRPRRHLRRL